MRFLCLIVVLAGCSAVSHASATDTTTPVTIGRPAPTTVPPVRQPVETTLPTPPGTGISWGDRGAIVLAYERRLAQLHFDPGPVDGVYSQDTQYAVTAVDKLFGFPRDGVINTAVERSLERFRYQPALPTAEGDRVEINLDTQVLTAYQHSQPILITTASTGSGEYFCGGTDGCQYAITPTGHFHFQTLFRGWEDGKLGRMWNPYYFNGGIAVHGLPSVPSYPASHGCVRIPMDIANYFPSLVSPGESVYVFGTAKKPGNGYVGPTSTTSSTTTTPAPKIPLTTTAPRSTTTAPPTTTTVPPTTTTVPRTTTSTAVARP